MAKRKAGTKKAKQATDGQNGGIVALTKELFQAAITLRGSVEPADYKRYVLPIIFLRFLSLRYERRRAELEALVADKKSDYFGDKKAIHDPDEYRRVGAFVIPEEARWENMRKAAQADDIKVRLDDVLDLAREEYPDKLKGLLPRIYAGSNLDAVNVPRPDQPVHQGHLPARPRRRRPDRPRLRVLHRRVRLVRGEARRRVLHAGQHREDARRDARAREGRRVRPLLRLGRHVRAVRPLHPAQPPALLLRPGEQGLHLPAVPDEPLHPRARRQYPSLETRYFDDKHATLKADYLLAKGNASPFGWVAWAVG